MKVLFIGDIYGSEGVDYLIENLPNLKATYRPNLIIVNGENSYNGRGISLKIYKRLMASGVNLITMGNHTWKNEEIKSFISDANIIKPINDNHNLGNGYKVINYNDKKFLVINALGKVYMDNEYPLAFEKIKEILNEVPHDYSLLDFHAEITSEKIALAHYLDGLVDIIVGTHTHVQTNDARILPKKTLYISDVGMTGPLNGVIGVSSEIIIDRFINGYSLPNKPANGPRQLNGVIISLIPNRTIIPIHLEEEL